MSANKAYPIDSTAPVVSGASVTPNDAADLAVAPCRALAIGTGGNLQVTFAKDADGTSVVVPVQAGIVPFAVKRVWAASTTATGIVALY